MRVAYLSRAPFISGAERSLQLLLEAVPMVGIDPLVIGPADSKLHNWCAERGIAWATCPLELRDRWRPWAWWRSVAGLRRILQRESIDLIHSNQIWSYQAVGKVAGQMSIPRLCHMRDEVDRETLQWCLKSGVEGVLCISQHMQHQIESAWPDIDRPQWIATLLNPVRSVSAPAAAERRERAAAGTTFGFIGQIRAVKGLTVLLEALSQLPADKRWKLRIAGQDPQLGAPYEAECRRIIAARGISDRVTWLGFLDDVADFYQSIDVAIVPSLEEPLGRIPLEAGSFGLPSIVSDVGGLPETLEDGVTGWLAPPGDIDAWRKALQRFIDTPDPEAGASAKRWVSDRCDPARYAAQLVDLYRTLLDPNAISPEEALERSAG